MALESRTGYLSVAVVALTMLGPRPALDAQQLPVAAVDTLPNGPLVFDSSTRGPSGRPIPGPKFRVVPLRGLTRPFALAFLPNRDILITERAGQLRIVRHGVLDPQPISGMPEVVDRSLRGLNDIAVHPRFAENRWIYFTYYKPEPGSSELARATLARGRFDGGSALTDVADLFVADKLVSGPSISRIVFGRDGHIFMSIGIPIPVRGNIRPGVATNTDAQDSDSHYGKILRLRDDGSAPPDNPFAGRPGHKPELYALGIRNALGLAVHPETGELWEHENGPQGGDELNIIRASKNYGWPVVSYGRSYTGTAIGDSGPVTDQVVAPDVEQPLLFWAPSIALSGLAFYTGDRFPEWKGSVFVGGLVGAQIQRIVMNQEGLPIRRDTLLSELKQRISDVRHGPDGLLYLLTHEVAGALLKIEPVDAGPAHHSK